MFKCSGFGRKLISKGSHRLFAQCEEWAMSSPNNRPVIRSAAWRISLWGTAAFALGAMMFFVFLHRFFAEDIQLRSDAWLSGEVEVLGNVRSEEHTSEL